MRMFRIAAVLPVFNRVNETVACLKKLDKINNSNISITTILIDDGSTDGTFEIVSENFSNVRILKGNGTLWWAGGVNKGLKFISNNIKEFDYILILNNDTLFDEKTLLPLLTIVRSKKKTVCASVLIDEESGKIYNAGQIRSGFFQKLKPLFKGDYISQHRNKIISCDTVCTNFLLMPATILVDVGFFNSKKFRHGFSDFEYFLRAKKTGYQITVNTKSAVSTLQNKNYLSKRLVEQDFIPYLKSFFDVKYDTNLKLIFFTSFAHKSFLIGLLTLIINIMSISRWTYLKLILPTKKLEKIVKSKWVI